MRANELIERALVTLGVIGAGETVDAGTSSDCFRLLNDMVDQWGAERLTIFTRTRSVQTLSSGTQEYTIGTGGTFDIERPEWIESASIIPDNTVAASSKLELPVPILNESEWQGVTVKGVTSTFPTKIFYDYSDTSGRGIISVWPIPSGSNVGLVLYIPAALSEFADLTTDYSFPKGYRRALHYKLAECLAPDFGRPFSPDQRTLANKAFGIIKEHNARPFGLLKVDPALVGSGRGYFNWRTGQS